MGEVLGRGVVVLSVASVGTGVVALSIGFGGEVTEALGTGVVALCVASGGMGVVVVVTVPWSRCIV